MDHAKVIQLYLTFPLPSIAKQMKLSYKTSVDEIEMLFYTLNCQVFDNALLNPKVSIFNRSKEYWALCEAIDADPDDIDHQSTITIHMFNKWYCKQWVLCILAHEMCHQYQWEVIGPKRLIEYKEPHMSHGPTFFALRNRLLRHGIPLKRYFNMERWFKYQSINRC